MTGKPERYGTMLVGPSGARPLCGQDADADPGSTSMQRATPRFPSPLVRRLGVSCSRRSPRSCWWSAARRRGVGRRGRDSDDTLQGRDGGTPGRGRAWDAGDGHDVGRTAIRTAPGDGDGGGDRAVAKRQPHAAHDHSHPDAGGDDRYSPTAGAEPFESDSLSQGQTFAQQLTVAGEYRYIRRIHEGSGGWWGSSRSSEAPRSPTSHQPALPPRCEGRSRTADQPDGAPGCPEPGRPGCLHGAGRAGRGRGRREWPDAGGRPARCQPGGARPGTVEGEYREV